MKTIRNAKAWHKLWSVRLAVISAALCALEVSLPLWSGVVPQSVFAALSTVTAAASAVARVIRQEGFGDE